MQSNKKMARIAGGLYLGVVITGIFSLMYVPSRLFVWDDPAATVQNIRASETLYRLSIVSTLACYTIFLFLPLALYRLLHPVNKTCARIMVILAVVSVPVSFINLLNKFAALSLSGGQAAPEQIMFYLNQYNNGILIVQIFWGLWLFPLGYLIVKSGILPKFLGILLMTGCFSYLINFLGGVLIPGYSKTTISSVIMIPASLGEIGTCLWLLIAGAKEKRNASNSTGETSNPKPLSAQS